MEKIKVQDAKVVPNRGPKALKASSAGKQKNADGSQFSTPNPHRKTRGY
jgi:hypothetical protein